MFVELMPLLTSRTVLITVTKVEDKTLRVNVVPVGRPTTIQLSARPFKPPPVPTSPRTTMRRKGKQ